MQVRHILSDKGGEVIGIGRDATLAEAARAFSRYSDIRILVSADVENQTVTGLFVANDPVGFAKAAALSLGLRTEIDNRGIRLDKPDMASP